MEWVSRRRALGLGVGVGAVGVVGSMSLLLRPSVQNDGSESEPPASEDLLRHYDATQLSASTGGDVSTWDDETGQGPGLQSGSSPTYVADGINGNPVVSFNAENQDFLDTDFAARAQPNHIFVVFRATNLPSDSDNHFIFSSTDSNAHNSFLLGTENSSWRLWGSNTLNGSGYDTDAHYAGALFNGTNSELRIDGSTDASGDAGSDDLNGFRLADYAGGGFYGTVEIGEVLVYPEDKSGIQTGVEQYLSDKWGFSGGGSGSSESWTQSSSNPLISTHGDPDWIEVDGTYYVYTVRTAPEFGQRINLYTSPNGVNFTEHSNSPVITPNESGWDSAEISDPSIEEVDGTYYLYWGDNQDDFGVATASTPEGPFTRSDNNPVLSITQSWEGSKMTEVHVRERNGTFYMTYTGDTGSGEALGLATSSDGVSWTKESANPIYDSGDINDQCHIYANGVWHLYYTEKGSLNIEKVTSSDITSFSGPETESLATSASDYSPAIRYNSGEAEYWMYWHPDSGSGGTDESIDLATSPDLDA